VASARQSSRGLVAPLLWALVIVVAPGGVYALRVVKQQHRLTEYRLRTLDTAASRVGTILRNAGTTMNSLKRDLGYACSFFERQPYLELGATEECGQLGEKLESCSAESMKTFLVHVRGEVMLWSTATEGIGRFNPDSIASTPCDFTVRVRLKEILDELPLDGAFDLVAVVDESGRVVEERGTAGLHVARVDSVQGTSGEALTIDDLKRTSLQQEVRLFGSRYLLLTHPVRMPASYRTGEEGDDDPVWVLCGFVDAGAAFRGAMEVSPVLIMILVLVLVFGLLAWPFIKLLLLGRRERIRFADCYFLLLSTMAILMLGTVLLADRDSYVQHYESAKEDLEVLGREVAGNFIDELRQLRAALQSYDRALARAGGEGVEDCEKDLCSVVSLTGSCRRVAGESGQEPQGEVSALCDPVLWKGPTTLPFFSSVFWMEPEHGRQFIKGTVDIRNTPFVPLGEREYFKRVQSDRLWKLGGDGPDDRFFVQSFLSKTTGERSAALSMRSQLRLRQPDGSAAPPTAVAISTPMVSVGDPVLPPGYGFAVVKPDGTVVFHSDKRRTVAENLFHEVDDAQRLRSAVVSGSPRHLVTTYLGRRQLMYVRPMEHRRGDQQRPDGLPWFVVSFLEREVVSTTNLEALAEAIILGFVYFAVMFILPTVAYVAVTGKNAGWLWPNKENTCYYQAVTWVNVWLALILVVLIQVVPGLWCVRVCFIVPFFSVALAAPRFLCRTAAAEPANATGEDAPDATIDPSGDARNGEPGGNRGSTSTLVKTWVRWWRRACTAFLEAYDVAVCAIAGWKGSTAVALTQLGFGCILVAGTALLAPYQMSRLTVAGGLMLLVASAAVPLVLRNLRPTRDADPSLPDERPSVFGIRAFLFWHCAAAVMAWLVFAVLPAYGFFRVAHRNQQVALAKYQTLMLAQAIADRDDRVREWYRQRRFPVDDGTVQARLNATEDIYAPRTLLSYSGISATAGGDSGVHDWKSPAAALFPSEQLARRKPIYNGTSGALRYMLSSTVPGGSWSWMDRRREVLGLSWAPSSGSSEGSSRRAMRLAVAGPRLGRWSFIGGALLVLGLVCWVRFSALRLFFAAIVETVRTPRQVEQDLAQLRRVCVVGSPESAPRILERLGSGRRMSLGAGFWETTVAQGALRGPVVVCEDFAYDLEDGRTRELRLRQLESLVGKSETRVLLLASIDPTNVLLGGATRGELGEGDVESRRWSQALEGYTFITIREPPTEVGERTQEYPPVKPSPATKATTADEERAHERTVDARLARYYSLWLRCSDNERRVLVQLAQESFVNPKQARTVHRLLVRRIVMRDPVLRFRSHRFELFVRRLAEDMDVASLEEPIHGIGWARWRWVVLGLLLIIAVFLFATQRAYFETTLGFISATAVGLPALLKVVKVAYQSRGGGDL